MSFQLVPKSLTIRVLSGRRARQLRVNSAGTVYMTSVLGGDTVYSELRLSVARSPGDPGE